MDSESDSPRRLRQPILHSGEDANDPEDEEDEEAEGEYQDEDEMYDRLNVHNEDGDREDVGVRQHRHERSRQSRLRLLRQQQQQQQHQQQSPPPPPQQQQQQQHQEPPQQQQNDGRHWLAFSRPTSPSPASAPHSGYLFSASAFLRGYDSRIRGATLRGKVFVLLEDPHSSAAAYFLNLAFMFLVVFATIAFCLETVQALSASASQQQTWASIETFVTIVWTIEFVVRVWCHPHLFQSGFTLIDFFAILPFYVEVIIAESYNIPLQSSRLSGSSVVRLIRLVRVLRLLKFVRSSDKLLLLIKAIRRSVDGIQTMLFVLSLSTILFSSLIYHAEISISYLDSDGFWRYSIGPEKDHVTQFQNIVDSFWWCLVTMTTVGYGDAFPLSGFGKMIGGLTMVAAMLLLAFPATIIGANLTEVYDEYRQKKLQDEQYRQQLLVRRRTASESGQSATPGHSRRPSIGESTSGRIEMELEHPKASAAADDKEGAAKDASGRRQAQAGFTSSAKLKGVVTWDGSVSGASGRGDSDSSNSSGGAGFEAAPSAPSSSAWASTTNGSADSSDSVLRRIAELRAARDAIDRTIAALERMAKLPLR